MFPKVAKRLRLVWGILTSALILCAGGALILACVTIYRSSAPAAEKFTYETIATAFSRIALLVWAAVGAILVGLVLALLLPEEGKRTGSRTDEQTALQNMARRYDLDGLPAEAADGISRLCRLRQMWTVTAAVGSAVLAIPAMVWVLLPDSYGGEDKTHEVLVGACILLGCALAAMAISLTAVILRDRYARRERAIIKLAVANRTVVKREEMLSRRRSCLEKPCVLWTVRGGILAVALLFILLGVFNGGMSDVLGKAIRICTECIGLG